MTATDHALELVAVAAQAAHDKKADQVLAFDVSEQIAITDAFVRASGGALLLPRLVALGDPDLGEGVGAAIDPVDAEPVPPAVPPMRRRMMLARLIVEAGAVSDTGEAVRLADVSGGV